jgi:hypothetical protein
MTFFLSPLPRLKLNMKMNEKVVKNKLEEVDEGWTGLV